MLTSLPLSHAPTRPNQQIDNYCELIRRGKPDLIEIKAVTYCGKSDASSLTIRNSPWYEEVRKFAQAIVDRVGDEYGLAAEHVHSTCALVGKKEDMLIEGEWHTWIDYPKFQTLIHRYYADGTSFKTKDYMAKTPTVSVTERSAACDCGWANVSGVRKSP